MQWIRGTSSDPIAFDTLIEAIVGLYPATRVVQQDWFADRHAQEVALCKQNGWPMDFPPLVSLERRWAEVGVQRGVEVHVREDIVLYGRMDKEYVIFTRERGTFQPRHVLPLIELLEGAGVRLTFG